MSGSASYERTRLAWRRTVLTALVVGILCGRMALESEAPAVAGVLVGVVAVVWLGVFAVGQWRIRRLGAGLSAAPARVFPLVVGLISGYLALSVILVLRAG